MLIAGSVLLLRGIRVDESLADRPAASFMRQLRDGLRFVFRTRMLWMLALFVGCWQLLHHMASVVQILVATRELGMTAQAIGMCYVGMGVGTILASVYGKRVSERVGPGPTIVAGFAVSAVGWLALAVAPASVFGVVLFGFMLTCFSGGATLIFVNFLSLRQAVTPEPLLGRMTSTMRWLILIGAGPGALIGGYVGEHIGLRASLAMAGLSAVVLTIFAWRSTVMMGTRSLPKPASLPIQG